MTLTVRDCVAALIGCLIGLVAADEAHGGVALLIIGLALLGVLVMNSPRRPR